MEETMKIKAVILSILFFSLFVFAEESDTGEFYDEDDCGDTGCVDTGDTGDSEPADSAADTEAPVYYEELVECSNDAGRGYIFRTITDGQYEEYYHYACVSIPQNKVGSVDLDGNVEVTEENCKSYLEKECGTKLPVLSDYCGDEEIERCIRYESGYSHCSDYHETMTEEEIRAEIDNYKDPGITSETMIYVYECCTNIHFVDRTDDCLEEAKCRDDEFTDECCKCYIGEIIGEPGDTGDTEIPGDTGDSEVISPAPDSGDTENSEVPADGATAPTENKEEKKSDGCSVLFV